jgi:hypothetical protein
LTTTGAPRAPASCIAALVEIKLLGLDALSSVLELRFVPGIEEQLGNLLGLDVLSFFDFGLSHANRVGYLGRA